MKRKFENAAARPMIPGVGILAIVCAACEEVVFTCWFFVPLAALSPTVCWSRVLEATGRPSVLFQWPFPFPEPRLFPASKHKHHPLLLSVFHRLAPRKDAFQFTSEEENMKYSLQSVLRSPSVHFHLQCVFFLLSKTRRKRKSGAISVVLELHTCVASKAPPVCSRAAVKQCPFSFAGQTRKAHLCQK